MSGTEMDDIQLEVVDKTMSGTGAQSLPAAAQSLPAAAQSLPAAAQGDEPTSQLSECESFEVGPPTFAPTEGSFQMEPPVGSLQGTPQGDEFMSQFSECESFKEAPTEGSFQVAPTEGSFQVAPTEGSFQVAPTEGSFQGAPTEGSFQVAPTEGSFPVLDPPQNRTVLYRCGQMVVVEGGTPAAAQTATTQSQQSAAQIPAEPPLPPPGARTATPAFLNFNLTDNDASTEVIVYADDSSSILIHDQGEIAPGTLGQSLPGAAQSLPAAAPAALAPPCDQPASAAGDVSEPAGSEPAGSEPASAGSEPASAAGDVTDVSLWRGWAERGGTSIASGNLDPRPRATPAQDASKYQEPASGGSEPAGTEPASAAGDVTEPAGAEPACSEPASAGSEPASASAPAVNAAQAAQSLPAGAPAPAGGGSGSELAGGGSDPGSNLELAILAMQSKKIKKMKNK